ncbi:acyltransferase family protein [Tamaricihabitans halophyticus]|uniref:acyltransferase family protein n=1 Tax=Tamaricihabitans halophyticus TaxID=1262583 RepID=UPI0014053E2D|nr:acyltransferase [Tamaricihabitans halophyticus]
MERGSHYMHGLDLMRVICSIAVVYNHIANWARLNDEGFLVSAAVEGGIIGPLHLNALAGFVGVGAFLLISGVVVTHVAFAEGPGQFLARRGVRLLPALWVAVLFAWVLVTTGLLSAAGDPDANDLWKNALLLNFSLADSASVLGVTWTLVIQVVFWTFLALCIPLLRRWPWLPPAIAACGISLLLSYTHTITGTGMHQLRMIATFLPVAFIGLLVSLVRKRKLSPLAGIALGAVFFWLGVRAVLTWEDTPNGEGYARTLLLLVLVLLLCSKANGRIARARWVKVFASRTYVIYLLHVPLAFPVLTLLTPVLGFGFAVLVALLSIAVGTELTYRFVEKPAADAYRRWEQRRKLAKSKRRAGMGGHNGPTVAPSAGDSHPPGTPGHPPTEHPPNGKPGASR